MKALNRSHLCLALALLAALPALSAADVSSNELAPTGRLAVEPMRSEVFGHYETGGGVVSFVVTESGDVDDVKVDRSTNDALNDLTASAIREWKFNPAVRNGQPFRCVVTKTLKFD